MQRSTVHEVPELRVVAGRLRDGVSGMLLCLLDALDQDSDSI